MCFLSCITRRDDNLKSTATSNPSGTTDAIFTKLPRPLAKDRKNISHLATYLAFFSVTYLATSLKLAKFSVTERTAGLSDRSKQGQGWRKSKRKRGLRAEDTEHNNNDKHRLKSSESRRSNTSVNRVAHTGRGHTTYQWPLLLAYYYFLVHQYKAAGVKTKQKTTAATTSYSVFIQWRHRSAGGPLTDLGLGPLPLTPRAPPLDPNQLK